jgi:hypothetical protein
MATFVDKDFSWQYLFDDNLIKDGAKVEGGFASISHVAEFGFSE